MNAGRATHLTDEPARQIIAQRDVCVATGIGPDGSIDGTLLFGPSGLVQITPEGLCRFPLTAITEGSPLRAWLRISRHSPDAAPWALLFVARSHHASLLLVGTARLIPGGEGPERQRTTSLVVEVTPVQVTHQRDLSLPTDASLRARTTASGVDDAALRVLAEKPAKELTIPIQSFLARQSESFFCSIDRNRRPQIQYVAADLERTLTQGPDIAIDPLTVYVRSDSHDSGISEGRGGSPSSHALLIVPSYASGLAIRIAGPAHVRAVSDVPAPIAGLLDGATTILALTVSRVDAQAGDWSTAPDPAGPGDNIRVAGSVLRIHGARSVGRAEVSFVNGPTVLARGGESLLELAEANGVPMEAGCRMGICGADPVRIDAGVQNLSRIRRSEQSTLDRMGLPPGCRMACSARVQGPVTVGSTDELNAAQSTGTVRPSPPAAFRLDPDVRRVVVIGTGIAGITAVEEVRKLHPDVDITVVGAEHHDFYNRMAISRLVDEDTTPDKLSLMSSDWARRRRVQYLPGVSVAAIDRGRKEVVPTGGEPLPYDRLMLAMGARSRIPPIEGIERQGAFALRTLDDALEIRRHIHLSDGRRAVVIGGGLLGLEAAYHLVQTGLRVSIVGRGEWPANRQLDKHAGSLLLQMLQDLGIEYVPVSEPRRLVGNGTVAGVELLDGRVLPASLCLVAAGIVPDVDLARHADLEVVQGVVVDDHMRTSDDAIYAAGDVIEYRGRTFGLWPASVDQALVAATNLVGGDLPYHATMAPAQLKVPGIDLLSVGEVAPRDSEEHEVRAADRRARRYRKLVLRHGRAIGAVAIGWPALFDGITDAVQSNRDVSDHLQALERGDWSILAGEDHAELQQSR